MSRLVEGVLLDRRDLARYGSWLAKLARTEYRRNATPLPADLADLLDTLDRVGFLARTSDGTSAASAVPPPTGVVPSAPCAMSTGEAARLLNVTPQRIRRMCATGRLRADRVRGNWVLSRIDVEDEAAARAAGGVHDEFAYHRDGGRGRGAA